MYMGGEGGGGDVDLVKTTSFKSDSCVSRAVVCGSGVLKSETWEQGYIVYMYVPLLFVSMSVVKASTRTTTARIMVSRTTKRKRQQERQQQLCVRVCMCVCVCV